MTISDTFFKLLTYNSVLVPVIVVIIAGPCRLHLHTEAIQGKKK
jgi:hypothetical protein